MAIGKENVTDFTRDYVRKTINTLLSAYMTGNISQTLKIVENVYFPTNIKVNDNLEWFKTYVRVSSRLSCTTL